MDLGKTEELSDSMPIITHSLSPISCGRVCHEVARESRSDQAGVAVDVAAIHQANNGTERVEAVERGTAIAKGTAVPIIKKQESSKRAGAAEGAESSILIGADQGSQSLHIEEVSVAPNAPMGDIRTKLYPEVFGSA
jgi:hypothetical protein